MITRAIVVAAMAALALPALAACGGGASGPPHVVSTSPALNATVPAGATTLSVTFDRPMGAGASFVQMMTAPSPPRVGEPSLSADKKTISVPVNLQPNMTYTVGLNSLNYHEFKDAAGTPATPYVLTFKTTP